MGRMRMCRRGREILSSALFGAILAGTPLFFAPPALIGQEAASASLGAPQVGPPAGSLVLAGGGELGFEIWERFATLAGGHEARIVVIPTAGTDDEFPVEWGVLESLRAAGAHDLTILHTRSVQEANSEEFAGLLRNATGAWLPGGRTWRLVDPYLNTLVHDELIALLDRGGVVGGTSAGASIMASFLVRGDPATNQRIIFPDYAEGFGFLASTAVDQHLHARGRQEDLWEVLALHPELLGIGLDERTALVVRGNRAEVIGDQKVLIYDTFQTAGVEGSLSLVAGEVFDLGLRTLLPSEEGAAGVPATDR